MNNSKGLSLVVLMIIIALVSLSLRIVIEEAVKITITTNESDALSNLKLISAALENYAKDNKGLFPPDVSVLLKDAPAYLDKDYILESPYKGYNYSCLQLDESGYNCSAAPYKCGITGRNIYYISTGGSLLTEGCVAN